MIKTTGAPTFSLSRRAFVGGAGALALAPSQALGGRQEKWETVSRNYNRRPRPPTETRIVKDPSVSPMIYPGAVQTTYDAIARYEIMAARGGWGKLPQVRIIVPGSRGVAVRALRARLAAEGYLAAEQADGDRFDEAVENAVRQFQSAHGLYAHGRVDAITRRELDVPISARLASLRANLPRIEEYSKALSARYIVVNIPAGQLDAVENGILYSRHNVIAGRPDRPSPALISKVSELNFHPYWNAPKSIVERDILPELRKGNDVLKKLNIRVFDGYNGPEVDPKTLDWKTLDTSRYFFRQEPGEQNAMATVKINFDNKYYVYLHDTPTKQLFTAGARYFSSGCVRVDQVHLLTSWILRNQPGWDSENLRKVVNSRQRMDVKVDVDPPVLILAYLTAWVTRDGRAHFRPDIYKLDGTGFVMGQPAPVSDS